MKGRNKFSPRSGVELSREKRYPGTLPLREALDGSGELTNGELTSRSATALLEYFKRCHAKHHDVGPVHTDLYYQAWEAIQTLRESDPWDCWLWYALAERLTREGYETEWMFFHVEPHCPRCSSAVRIEPTIVGYDKVKCASGCGKETASDRTVEMVDRIWKLYEAAFETKIEELVSI